MSTPANIEILSSLDANRTDTPDEPAPYHISEVPNKGLGMIANRRLRRGDRIMTKTPAVLIHREFLEQVPR